MASITPLIKKYKKQTLVTFQSASEDLTFSTENPNRKFKFSKFALLNLPKIKEAVNGENSIRFNGPEGSFVNGLSNASPVPENIRIDFSESLQNYLLNIETLLISNETYNQNLDLTVSERVFWKWLKEIGAIRFNESGSEKSNNISDIRFIEEPTDNVSDDSQYSRIVKYIGTIDTEGTHKSNYNSYKEIYIYVPTQNGNTPAVLFKTISDENYYPGQIIKDINKSEYIKGRSSNDNPTSAGLRCLASYDIDVPYGSLKYTINDNEDDKIWFDLLATAGPNIYATDQSFTDPSTDKITREDLSTGKSLTYNRSRLDGISIDFDINNYEYFRQNPTKNNFSEFSSSSSADSFEFNTVLLYYDTINPLQLDSNGDPVVLATNLFGVLFLNDIENTSAGIAQIKPLQKIKPNKIIGNQGNGYGIKLNLKLDVSSDSVDKFDYEISVDPYNNFSMELFIGALQMMESMNSNYELLLNQNLYYKSKIEELSDVIFNGFSKTHFQEEINEIKLLLTDVTPNSNLSNLISSISDKVNNILKGNTNVGIDFFFDLEATDDLRLTLENKLLKFSNKRQQYPFIAINQLSTNINNGGLKSNIIKKYDNTTLFVHYNEIGKQTANDILHIFIDDTIEWENGQLFKIIFDTEIVFNNFGIIIYTDVNNKLKLTNPYSKVVKIFSDINTLKPTIDVICTNKAKLEFVTILK